MIGQTNIINRIDNMIDKFPNFIVLVSPRGSGKTMLAKYIASKLNATLITCGIKVDEIREMIDMANTVRDTTLYFIKDADTMRAEAKNAMLKITEEPPKNAYFVLSVTDDSTLLDTIKSRAYVFQLEPYSRDELKTYFWQNYNEGGEEVNMITDIAETPYEVDLIVKYGLEFIEYVNLVIDNIAEVQSANAFKSGNKLAFKDEEDKYDLKVFWTTFSNLCLERLSKKGRCSGKTTLLCHYINVTNKYIYKLNRLGVNKQQLYDSWVFAIREVYYGYN